MARYVTRREALARIAGAIAGAYLVVDGVTGGPVKSFVRGLFLGSAEAVPQYSLTETFATPETRHTPSQSPEPKPQPTPEVKDLFLYAKEQLARNIPHLRDYPLALDIAALQVIKQGLVGREIYLPDKRTGQKRLVNMLEEYAFPGIEFPVRLQVDRKIDALNGLNLKDKRWEKEALGQVLLPVELMLYNIRTGESWKSGVNYQRREEDKMLIGLFNVSTNPEQYGIRPEEWATHQVLLPRLPDNLVERGRSPQEWLRETAVREYQDKNSKGYKEALRSWPPLDAWPSTAEAYKKRRETMLVAGEDLPIFVAGYPTSLNVRGIVPYDFHEGSEYAVLVGRSFGKPVFVVTANYPKDMKYKDDPREGKHDEPYVLTKYGEFVGFWSKEPFVEDYEGKANKPIIYPSQVIKTSFVPFEP